jgi:hypothetical protein
MQRAGMGMVYSRPDEDRTCATMRAWALCGFAAAGGFQGGANSLFLGRINTINNRI